MKNIAHKNTFVLRNWLSSLVVAIGVLLITSTISLAAPDKKNTVSGQEVAAMYQGKTWIWSKGSSYWAPDASFQATWEGSVAVGKWYATNRGNLCYEAVWIKEASSPGAEVKRCWMHVRDSKGALWKQDLQTKEWYRADKEMNERVRDGNVNRSEFNALRRKVGM